MPPTTAERPSQNDEVQRLREEIAEAIAKFHAALARLEKGAMAPAATRDALALAISAFTGLGYALSARALLLLSLVGAFVLAIRAIDIMGLAVLVAYALFVIVPVVTLEIRKVRQ